MQSGKLRRRVTIKYKVVTRDSYGQETIAWTEYMTAWASVQPLTGNEFIQAQMEQATQTVMIAVRAQPSKTVTPTMRVYDGSTVYEIIAVQNMDTRGREIRLTCKVDLNT